MKRGPPMRNGGPPPKRSAPSGPMGRGKCGGQEAVEAAVTIPEIGGYWINVIAVAAFSPHVQGQRSLWSPSSQRLHDVQEG